jgi:hypothetical protein
MLAACDVVLIDGIPLTSGVRTSFDVIRHASGLRRAVAAGDGCLRHGFATAAELADYAMARPGWRGVGQVRRAVPLLDGRSESPKESELRLIWIDSGLGIPVPQCRIADPDGVFIARVDLLDAKAGVVGEYQGRWHRAGSRPWHDTTRNRRLDGVGLEVVEFWAPDVSGLDAVPVAALTGGYGRAARRDPAERTYLILLEPGRDLMHTEDPWGDGLPPWLDLTGPP